MAILVANELQICLPLHTKDRFRFFVFVLGCHHAEGANFDYQLQLEIWKGNLGGALELAADNKQLVDWLVAMSPLGKENICCSLGIVTRYCIVDIIILIVIIISLSIRQCSSVI